MSSGKVENCREKIFWPICSNPPEYVTSSSHISDNLISSALVIRNCFLYLAIHDILSVAKMGNATDPTEGKLENMHMMKRFWVESSQILSGLDTLWAPIPLPISGDKRNMLNSCEVDVFYQNTYLVQIHYYPNTMIFIMIAL